MPRIRSIKPEFFTSETIASVPKSARLTFIGLWTYADDNGVAPDNVRLITAAVDPLEEDPREALRSTREDLRRLHEAGLVVRFRAGGKRYIYVTSWDEHQKISHPAKPRYLRPTEDGCEVLTCADVVALEDGPASSGGTPEGRRNVQESLLPEQGAGSREQGAGEQGTQQPPAAAATAAPPSDSVVEALTETQRSKALTDAYHELEPMCKWPAVNGVVLKAIRSNKFTDEEIGAALARLAKESRGVTVETLRVELVGLPPKDHASNADSSAKDVNRDPAAYKNLYGDRGRRGA